jgi:hypothetical protein
MSAHQLRPLGEVQGVVLQGPHSHDDDDCMKPVPPERPAAEWRGLKFLGSAGMAELWQNAGFKYRLGRVMVAIALVPACVAGALVAAVLTHTSSGDALAWAIGITAAVSVALILVGNYVRVGAIRRYRNGVT